MLLPGDPRPNAHLTCDGRRASFDFLVGTDKADVITGTPGDDVIIAGGGNDTINAGGGNDLICAGDGNDQVFGNPGDDVIFGGKGVDRIDGGRGTNILAYNDDSADLDAATSLPASFGPAPKSGPNDKLSITGFTVAVDLTNSQGVCPAKSDGDAVTGCVTWDGYGTQDRIISSSIQDVMGPYFSN